MEIKIFLAVFIPGIFWAILSAIFPIPAALLIMLFMGLWLLALNNKDEPPQNP
ncbi:hypothetical protein [Nostoc sp. CALU 1950]|uniref:hypothetical protein n=1 Tax=Nostoc sp. CALU 1950 TaxID=3104321 RepID=UPI003EB6BE4F